MKAKIFSLLILGAFMLGSCAKKTVNTTGGTTTYDDSYVINGNGFKNVVYAISSVAQQSCNYDASSNTTTVSISGTSGDSIAVSYDIQFTGKATGTYTLSPTGPNVITITTTPIKNPNGLQIYSSNSGAKLVVATYGASGSKITGTFSGAFSNTGNNYTFSAGTFAASVQ